MQPLFAAGEGHHQEADEQDQERQDLRPVTGIGPTEADAVAIHIGHPQAEHPLAGSRLP